MDKKQVLKAIETLNKTSKKRNFNQTYDFIINLRGLDFKKPGHQLDFFINISHKVKPKKVCALVGQELYKDAKEICDYCIHQDDFEKYKDKKLSKKLVKNYDFFIGQANLMGLIATVFGRVLGPRGKMPNPKAGCVVPPKGNLKAIYEKLQTTLRINVRSLVYQCSVGKADMEPEDVAENVLLVYDSLMNNLPDEKNNVRNVLLKLTMTKPVKIE